jgi:large subunit ribosomal protein L4
MATIKEYDLTGKETGEIAIDDALLAVEINSQMVKDYIVALRANQRQWSANTKTRAEVCHSGQKPHPQKGTGRARQGYLGAPQYKGGGRVGGPRAKVDQHVRINRREKRLAIRSLLADKVLENGVIALKASSLKEPKTKKIAGFLAKVSKSMTKKGRSVLFLGSEPDHTLVKSMRNIPGASFILLPNASGYDIAKAGAIVVLGPAKEQFQQIFHGE